MRSTETGFTRGDGKYLLYQVWIPGTGESRRNWEDGGVVGEESVRKFVMEKGGNAEPCVFHEKALNSIHERHGFVDIPKRMRIPTSKTANIRWSRDLANSICQCNQRSFLREESMFIKEIYFGSPHRAHLRCFFLKGHAPNKVGDPLGRRYCIISREH